VVQDKVEEDLQTATMRVGNEPVEVVDRPEKRVDRGVIGDVIAEVEAGRRVDR